MRNNVEGLKLNRRTAGILSFVMVVVMTVSMFAGALSDSWAAQKTGDDSKMVKQQTTMKVPYVHASSYVVMSASTSQEVYSKYPDRKMSMGAITKLMTAMVVIDNMYDDRELSNVLEIQKKVAKYGKTYASGDNLTIEDLLYCMLVGNDDESAEALARYSASKRSIFINEMNAKAMELELINTQFSNPTGKYSTDHYSSAVDCAHLVQAAIRYPKIKKILQADSYTAEVTNRKNGTRKVHFLSTNPLASKVKPEEKMDECWGGIMGQLSSSSSERQYAAVANIDKMQFVVIMMDVNKDNVVKDSVAAFKYGNYAAARNTLVKADKMLGKARVKGGASTRVPAYTELKGWAYIPPEGSTDLIKTEVVMGKGLKAPLKAGDKVGEYRIFVADELKGTVDLVIRKDVPKGWLPSRIYISNLATIIMSVIILTALGLYLRIILVRKKRRKKMEIKRKRALAEKARASQALKKDREMRKWTCADDVYKIPDEDFKRTLHLFEADRIEKEQAELAGDRKSKAAQLKKRRKAEAKRKKRSKDKKTR